MRYTRNRQLLKLNQGWKNISCLKMDTWRELRYELDPTFKWHRDKVNRVEFDIRAGSMKGTVILPVKWKEYSK